MMTNEMRKGDGAEQLDDEVVGYGGLSGGVIANNLLRLPVVLPSYEPTRSSGEEIPQIQLRPVPFGGRPTGSGDF